MLVCSDGVLEPLVLFDHHGAIKKTQRLQEVKKAIKGWERQYTETHERKPTSFDVKSENLIGEGNNKAHKTDRERGVRAGEKERGGDRELVVGGVGR